MHTINTFSSTYKINQLQFSTKWHFMEAFLGSQHYQCKIQHIGIAYRQAMLTCKYNINFNANSNMQLANQCDNPKTDDNCMQWTTSWNGILWLNNNKGNGISNFGIEWQTTLWIVLCWYDFFWIADCNIIDLYVLVCWLFCVWLRPAILKWGCQTNIIIDSQ